MQSKFEFLEDQFPKLASYGKNAEEALDSDNNICLLNLGRIAETITEILCRANNIEKNLDLLKKLEKLTRLDIINSEIEQKIKTLIEIKNEAEENNYDSEIYYTGDDSTSEMYDATEGYVPEVMRQNTETIHPIGNNDAQE